MREEDEDTKSVLVGGPGQALFEDFVFFFFFSAFFFFLVRGALGGGYSMMTMSGLVIL